MKSSSEIGKLAEALAKAQALMKGAIKDATNPHFRSGYATLAAHVDAIKVALASNGLSYSQFPVACDNGVAVETILMHSSGQWIMGEPFPMPVDKQNAQGVGSALTYARRYALSAITGIAPEDDDDGNAATLAAVGASKERPNHATQVAKDALADMSQEEQDFLRTHAAEIQKIHGTAPDTILLYIDEQKFDTEEKLALWSLLPSNVRTKIKELQRSNGAAK